MDWVVHYFDRKLNRETVSRPPWSCIAAKPFRGNTAPRRARCATPATSCAGSATCDTSKVPNGSGCRPRKFTPGARRTAPPSVPRMRYESPLADGVLTP